MSSDTRKYLLVGILSVVIIGGLIFLLNGKAKATYNWREHYAYKSRDPFGTFILHNILSQYFKGEKYTLLENEVAKSLPKTDSTANYVFVGDGFKGDTADMDALLDFAYRGNRVFLAANALPRYLLDKINFTKCSEYEEDWTMYDFGKVRNKRISANLNHPKLQENQDFIYTNIVRYDTVGYNWYYLDTIKGTCTEGGTNFTPLGTISGGYVNFARISFGEGAFFVHTNPMFFTNFHLINEDKTRYAAKIFSHLQKGTIYWDTKSHTSKEITQKKNKTKGENSKMDKDSPLKFVLDQPALRWAWFIFVGLIAIYMFFYAKRRQRIIPVFEEKTNASLEFTKTIGNMYFRAGDEVGICRLMLSQFQTFVRDRYHIVGRNMNTEYVAIVTEKSGLTDDVVRRIALFEKNVDVGDITHDSMVELNRLVTYFYQYCK